MDFPFKETDKKLLILRNEVFKEVGMPELYRNGFVKSIFSNSNFGRDNTGSFTYNFTRLSCSNLEFLIVYIIKGDKNIQIRLNIFDLYPKLNSINQLNGLNGLNFILPPNSKKQFRLRFDDYTGPPIFNVFKPKHKIGTYFTKSGLEREVEKLSQLIKEDMSNIDYFVKKWHEVHTPNKTDWNGNIVE